VRETFVSLAYVGESGLVQEDFLQDECGNCFREFASRLHDTQTQWDDFGGQQEGDDFLVVGFDQCTDNTETRESEVLEGSSFACGVQKRVEEEGNLRLKEWRSCFLVRCYTL